MPTAHFSPAELRRAARATGHLLAFRAATVRRPRVVLLAALLLGGACVAAALAPLWLPDADLSRLLHPALAGVVLAGAGAASAGGGGRELLPRDALAVHPVSPVADHLGALVLAPLSAGWLVPACVLLAVGGPGRLPLTVAWLLAATALAQVVGWSAELLRRGPRAPGLLRFALPVVATAALAGPAGVVARTDRVVVPSGVLVLVAVLLVLLGARLALATARRAPRDEGRLETRAYPVRPAPRSDLAVLRRIDRGSVWRSVPLRRGTGFLALAPGALALTGGLDWAGLTMLPGLVASGCVLLFGVNLWCLDGRGLLWRETLPVGPRTVVLARTWVLAELLAGAGVLTLALGAVRAGRPSAVELLAVVLSLVVVVGQAVSAALRWSAAHPHAVDLRSARATPAPPLSMVGYSLRLALATTASGLLLAGFASAGRTGPVLLVAAVSLSVSAARIVRAARHWSDPVRRAAIVSVVSAG